MTLHEYLEISLKMSTFVSAKVSAIFIDIKTW